MRLPRLAALPTAALLALACSDAPVTGPDTWVPADPLASHSGSLPGVDGTGSIGSGAPTPGADRQDFELDVAWDLTGRVFFRDWSVTRGDGTVATVTVDATDSGTWLSAYRDGSSACADPDRGVEVDGVGRLDLGDLVRFTIVVCDDGAADSGADLFRLLVPDFSYERGGLLAAGDVAKSSGPAPSGSIGIGGQGAIGTGSATAGSDWQEFTFETSPSSVGTIMYADWSVMRNGLPGRLVADPASDPPTGLSSYHQISSTCVRFGGTGRIDTGELLPFYVDACDNGDPGTGFDSFMIMLPDRGGIGVPYTRSGTLSSGDIDMAGGAPATGDLDVSTATTGSSLDPDGYTVTVDGTTSQVIPTNGSVTFTDLSAGDHTVELSGVAGNCTVSGGSSRTATVPSGGTASTTFSVSCASLAGSLTVTTSTTGSSLDPDGYMVTVDGTDGRPIPTNGSLTFTDLSAGDHTVELSGVADNCTVSGGSSRTATVPSGGTASVSFSVSCTAPPATRLVFTVQPSDAEPGGRIEPAVRVTALDAQGNRATGFSGLVTVAIGRNDSGLLTKGRLSGTTTVRAVDGVATFSDLSIDREGTYTLLVTSTGLTGAESQSFRIERSGTVCLLGICIP